ncbi:MAG TPA: hypothetical protein VFM45_13145 [Anaeromyxobacteraceae bacterium]|nr:hypothetical protein [Anaeromyxobacteraceae bacterium]
MKTILAAALALVLAAPAAAQETAPPAAREAGSPTAHRHLGFALRLDAGIGGMGVTAPSAVDSRSSVSGGLGVVVGGAVAENLILGGDLWGTGMMGRWSMMQSGDTAHGLGGVGLNVTYYLMPANVYLSASPSVTTLTSMTHSNVTSSTNVTGSVGFGAKLSVGKEWWVGEHWGLGLAGQFLASWNGNQGATPGTWTTLGGGVALSATYN